MTYNKSSSVLRNNSENDSVSLAKNTAEELYYEIKKALDIDEKEGVLTEEEAKKIIGIE